MLGRTNAGGSGGGGALNFQIVGSTTEPANPKENTIWVNTDTPVTGYVFSGEAPETASTGMLWMLTGDLSAVEFNATKKNCIHICPMSAKQYLGGAWVTKTAKTYQDGAWVDWLLYLFKDGVVNTKVVSGINATISDGALYFDDTITKGYCKTYTTKTPVDLTYANTIHYVMMCSTSTASAYFRGAVYSAAYNGDNIHVDRTLAAVSSDSPFNKEVREVVLDVSKLTGSYYVGYAWGVYSTASGNRSFSGYIYDWWLE